MDSVKEKVFKMKLNYAELSLNKLLTVPRLLLTYYSIDIERFFF